MRRNRLPIRLRLLVGFVAAMLIVDVAAGAFVFWRVQVALDHRLNDDLRSTTEDLRQAATRLSPAQALESLEGQAREAQLVRSDGTVLAYGPGLAPGQTLITAEQAHRASRSDLRTGHGYLFSGRGKHISVLAIPIRGGGPAAVAVTGVLLDQRDEALRELLAQLAIANLIALAIASLVGYRFAHLALDPVERYRAQAERISHGDTHVRLEIPPGPPDEITRLGATLNTMLDELERSSLRQQRFIDDASHELRTPLSTLAAEIDLTQRKPRTVAAHEAALQRIATDTTNLIDLAETLLTLGALGSVTPDAHDISATKLLDAAGQRARDQIEPHSWRTVTVRADEDLTIHADPILLERALGNLADNAVRHGEGSITLTAERRRNATILAVHDNGTIDPSFLDHAAERFRQDETARSSSGAGLGLSLVDEIAAAHDGQLRICSDGHHHLRPTGDPDLANQVCAHPERGTTVSLFLLS